MVVEHAIFVKIMHIAAGAMGGGGLATALGGYTYQKCRYVPVKRDLKGTGGEGDEVQEVEEAIKKAEIAGEMEEQCSEGLELLSWVITGSSLGCLGGLLAGAPVCHYMWHLAWRESWLHTAKAAGFFTPVLMSVALIGPGTISRNTPRAIAVSVGLSACASLAALPVSFYMAHPQSVLYYLAGLRIVACSGASILTAGFAQRYASIQCQKERDDLRANGATDAMNSCSIGAGLLAGTFISGCWMYVALTEWAEAEYPHWMSELPEVYFLAAVVHLLAPSNDHDARAETLMARSGLVALHAIVFIPELHTEVLHDAQLILGQGITSAWFGTFSGEWHGIKHAHHSPRHSPRHAEDHEKAEHAETGAVASDTFAHIAHSL